MTNAPACRLATRDEAVDSPSALGSAAVAGKIGRRSKSGLLIDPDDGLAGGWYSAAVRLCHERPL